MAAGAVRQKLRVCAIPVKRVVRSRFNETTAPSSTKVRLGHEDLLDEKVAQFIRRCPMYRLTPLIRQADQRYAGTFDIPEPLGLSDQCSTWLFGDKRVVKVYERPFEQIGQREYDHRQALAAAGLPCVPMECKRLEQFTILEMPNLAALGFDCLDLLLRQPISRSRKASALAAVAHSLKQSSSGWIHGDASVRNVFVQRDSLEVLWIDFAKAARQTLGRDAKSTNSRVPLSFTVCPTTQSVKQRISRLTMLNATCRSPNASGGGNIGRTNNSEHHFLVSSRFANVNEI